MPETPSPIIEQLESKSKEMAGESLEKIKMEWKLFLNLVDQALESPEEEVRKTAIEIVGKIIEVIKKYNNDVALELQTDLEVLLYEAEQVARFVAKLSTYTSEELKRFFSENLQLPQLSEVQKHRVEAMKVTYWVLQGCRAKIKETENPADETFLDGCLRQVASATKALIENPQLTVNDVARSFSVSFQQLALKIEMPDLTSLLQKDPISQVDLNKLRVTAVAVLRKLGSYTEAQQVALGAFPKECLAVKKLAESDITMRWNEAYHHAQIELYQEFDVLTKQGHPPEKAREILDAAAKALADQSMEFWEPLILFRHMDINPLSLDQKEVWDKINDMGDYKDEWLNFSDLAFDLSKEAVSQMALLVATVILPELVALRAVTYSTEVLVLLKSERMASYAEVLLGARYASLLGRTTVYSGGLLVGQVVGEAAYKTSLFVTGQETLQSALKGRPWLEDMLMGTLLEVPMELPVMLSGRQLTLAKEILIGIASSGLVKLGKYFIDSGQKELCAYFFVGALKNGEYKGDPRKILEFCGEEIYEMCGSPTLV